MKDETYEWGERKEWRGKDTSVDREKRMKEDWRKRKFKMEKERIGEYEEMKGKEQKERRKSQWKIR